MRNGTTPISFLLTSRIAGGGGVAGGMGPLMPTAVPFAFVTPFGVTDSDVKGPGIPLPLLLTTVFGKQWQMLPSPLFLMPTPTRLLITGVSRDNTGAVLANCAVALYRTVDDVMVERQISDANGNYSFSTVGLAEQYYIVAYKVGTPVRGTTDNTLEGSVNG